MLEAGSEYPRYVTPGFKPFDPVKLAKVTEKIVCKGDKRKYTAFYATGVLSINDTQTVA